MKRSINNYKAFLFLGLFAFLGACTTNSLEEKTEVNESVKVTFAEVESGDVEKYVANLAIDGMACEMACGNKIASTLNSIEGVRHAEIDFEGPGEINHALVEYDANMISEQELIKAVHGLANGHYKVNSVEVTHYKVAQQPVESEDENMSGYTPTLQYRLPDIFGVFARLF
jgi:copper chaperone CopZ